MWRTESDPRTRSSGLLLELLDSTPSWKRFLAAHEHATKVVPRLRDRVVDWLPALTAPTWTPDPSFSLERHVQRVRLSGPGTMSELLEVAAAFASRPIDTTRPPWGAVLVEGLAGGRSAYLLRVQHALTDGLGMMQLLGLAHSRTAAPGGSTLGAVGSLPVQPARPPRPLDLVAEQLRGEVASLPGRVGHGLGGALGRLGRALEDPLDAAGRAVDYGRSLARIIGPPTGLRTPLPRGPASDYRLLLHEVGLDELKAAARAGGCSVNDAYLAAVLGTFRRFYEHLGVHVEQLPMAIPISLREEDDPHGGNRLTGARFAAPVGERDPLIRMAQVAALTKRAREEPAIGFLDAVAPALSRLPAPALVGLASTMTAASDVQASNIPGLREPVFVAGAKVLGTYVIGPRPGVSAMVTMLSYAGTCCIGVNVDPALVAGEEPFTTCLRDGFDEVIALGRNARRRTR